LIVGTDIYSHPKDKVETERFGTERVVIALDWVARWRRLRSQNRPPVACISITLSVKEARVDQTLALESAGISSLAGVTHALKRQRRWSRVNDGVGLGGIANRVP
jgi:hypothetical protein